jgi:hypothetical protein
LKSHAAEGNQRKAAGGQEESYSLYFHGRFSFDAAQKRRAFCIAAPVVAGQEFI